MSYAKLTDAQITAGVFIKQATGRQFRDNQEDHEARILQLLAQSQHAIVDDFFYSVDGGPASAWIPASLYGLSPNSNILVDSDGSHVLQMTTVNLAASAGPLVSNAKCRLRLNQDMALFQEFRAKDPGTTPMDNILFGLQDQAVLSANAAITETDCVGFLKGTTAGKWRFRVASGGVGTQTDNIGNRATWQNLRLEILRSGGGATLQVRAFIDGAEISGSPFTTNIPISVILRPQMRAQSPASGTTDLRVDRFEMRWTAVPIAA